MTNPIKTTGLALLAATILSACSAMAHGNNDRGEDITRTYDFKGFDAISIGGVYEVDVKVGDSHSVTVSGRVKDMERVDVSIEDGRLILGTKKRKTKKKDHHGENVVATVTLPQLNALKISGVATGDVEGVKAETFELKVSGVAEIDIEGKCDRLKAKVSGVGELNAKDFKCKTSDISLSGVGEMSVYASNSIDISANGVGSVDVYGNPGTVKKNKSMFTTIKMK